MTEILISKEYILDFSAAWAAYLSASLDRKGTKDLTLFWSQILQATGFLW